MYHFRKRVRLVLVLFFLSCVLIGSTAVWAAPMLWTYPTNHFLISEVQYHGSPGKGNGTEWIEIYNPSGVTTFKNFAVYYGTNYQMMVPTAISTPYTFGTNCFLYFAYSAQEFYKEFNQCPDFARIADAAHCPDTATTTNTNDWAHEIDDNDESLFLWSLDRRQDMVAWGDSPPSPWWWGAATPSYPLAIGTAAPGETYLRGSDAPEWIGPGAEGGEVPGTPSTERLGEVWNLSGSVDVPWEGPEVGVCRSPTAVHLNQPAQVTAVQNGGYVAVLVGILGLLATSLVIVWSSKRAHPQ